MSYLRGSADGELYNITVKGGKVVAISCVMAGFNWPRGNN